jgi:hypothetical protein
MNRQPAIEAGLGGAGRPRRREAHRIVIRPLPAALKEIFSGLEPMIRTFVPAALGGSCNVA